VVDELSARIREPEEDPLAKIWEIAEDIGPPDLASNLDHYLYKSNEG
jgi:hypothetical protein